MFGEETVVKYGKYGLVHTIYYTPIVLTVTFVHRSSLPERAISDFQYDTN